MSVCACVQGGGTRRHRPRTRNPRSSLTEVKGDARGCVRPRPRPRRRRATSGAATSARGSIQVGAGHDPRLAICARTIMVCARTIVACGGSGFRARARLRSRGLLQAGGAPPTRGRGRRRGQSGSHTLLPVVGIERVPLPLQLLRAHTLRVRPASCPCTPRAGGARTPCAPSARVATGYRA
jgi:hypothetical protein